MNFPFRIGDFLSFYSTRGFVLGSWGEFFIQRVVGWRVMGFVIYGRILVMLRGCMI